MREVMDSEVAVGQELPRLPVGQVAQPPVARVALGLPRGAAQEAVAEGGADVHHLDPGRAREGAHRHGRSERVLLGAHVAHRSNRELPFRRSPGLSGAGRRGLVDHPGLFVQLRRQLVQPLALKHHQTGGQPQAIPGSPRPRGCRGRGRCQLGPPLSACRGAVRGTVGWSRGCAGHAARSAGHSAHVRSGPGLRPDVPTPAGFAPTCCPRCGCPCAGWVRQG